MGICLNIHVLFYHGREASCHFSFATNIFLSELRRNKVVLEGLPFQCVFCQRSLQALYLIISHLWDMGHSPEHYWCLPRGLQSWFWLVGAASELCCLRLLAALEWVMSMFCDSVFLHWREENLSAKYSGTKQGWWLVLTGEWIWCKGFYWTLCSCRFYFMSVKHTSLQGLDFLPGLCGPGAAPLPLWLLFGCFLKCGRQGYLEGCVCVWWVLAGECYSSVLESVLESWGTAVGFC